MGKKDILLLVLALGLVGCGSPAETSKIDEQKNEEQQEETKQEPKEEKKTYVVGDTVSVETEEGEYTITITGITETEERNQFSDTPANRVILISYSYENVSCADDINVSDINFKFYDKANKKMETYPASTEYGGAVGTGRNASSSSAYALNNDENYIELEFYSNPFNSKSDCMFVLEW